MRAWLTVAALPLAAVALGGAAAPLSSQSITLLGNGRARECEAHAKLAAEHMMSPDFAVATCTEALNLELLSPSDRAATLNNRGVVFLTMLDEVGAALDDFNAATGVHPERAESYINRGGVLLRQERFEAAALELDKGIALGNLREPWKAHYNRALAREAMGDLRRAREDYAQALALNPGWELATRELARFSVQAR